MDTHVTSAKIGGGAWIVSVTGELDLYSAPLLDDQLERARAGGSGIIVDLAAVHFIDSTALGVLMGARGRARKASTPFVLVSDDPRILRVFEITGLDRRFALERTLPDAVRAVSAAGGAAA